MTNEMFTNTRTFHREAREKMCDEKAVAYTMGGDDRLANFKTLGYVMNKRPMEILQVYKGKHDLAVNAFMNDNIERGEGVIQSIYDVQNYLDLLLAMIEEEADRYTGGSVPGPA